MLYASFVFGYYAKLELWSYVKRCPLNSSPIKVRGKRHVAKGELLHPVKAASGQFWEVLATMNHERIVTNVRNDPLLLKLAEQLSPNHAHD